MQDMQDLVCTNAESRLAKLNIATAYPVDAFDEAKYSFFHLIDRANNDKCIHIHDLKARAQHPPKLESKASTHRMTDH